MRVELLEGLISSTVVLGKRLIEENEKATGRAQKLCEDFISIENCMKEHLLNNNCKPTLYDTDILYIRSFNMYQNNKVTGVC